MWHIPVASCTCRSWALTPLLCTSQTNSLRFCYGIGVAMASWVLFTAATYLVFVDKAHGLTHKNWSQASLCTKAVLPQLAQIGSPVRGLHPAWWIAYVQVYEVLADLSSPMPAYASSGHLLLSGSTSTATMGGSSNGMGSAQKFLRLVTPRCVWTCLPFLMQHMSSACSQNS